MSELNYKLIKDYRNNLNLVNKYHVFISKIFPSISFKEWQNKGFWSNKYIPFSIVKNDEIVSNVSIAIMDVFVNGQKQVAAQIGAVGTLPEYRNKGLSRDLMNYVIEKFNDDVQIFFLFANETVMDYYPKFGFKNFHESIFTSETNISKNNDSAKKLNLNDKKDYILLIEILKRRKVITKIFGAEKYEFITMWHIFNIYSNDLFYLEDEDIIFIKTEKNGTLNILEIIFVEEFDIQTVLKKIISSDSIRKINYHFPPDQLKYKYDRVIKEQSGLFILSSSFNEIQHIKFPETAHT